jgi:hypothetical protein
MKAGKGNLRIDVPGWLMASATPTLARVACLAAGLAMLCTVAVGALAGGDALPQLPLAVNMGHFSYYDPATPFKDLMTQNGGLVVYDPATWKPAEDQLIRDSDGYPMELPSDRQVRIWCAFHIRPAEGASAYRTGRYVLLYEGTGTVALGWDAKNPSASPGRIEFNVPAAKEGIEIWIRSSQAEDHVRNLHVVHVDDEATFRVQPFNERFLDLLRPFSVIRFMNWGSASRSDSAYSGNPVSATANTITLPVDAPDQDDVFNGMVAMINVAGQWPRVLVDDYDGAARTLHLASSIPTSDVPRSVSLRRMPERTWAERAATNLRQKATLAGVAWEHQIQLANTLKAEPWFCVPTGADDDYVTQLANLIKSTLDPSLKFYLEYTNETWNYGFPGYDWSEAQGRRLALSGAAMPADAYHAYRAVEIWRIFNRVFGEADLRENRKDSRFVRVLTSQTAWVDRAKQVMDWTMPDNAPPTAGIPAHRYADAFAITLYFTQPDTVKESMADTIRNHTLDELMDIQKAHIDEMTGGGATPGCVRQQVVNAKARGLRALMYEGGTHLIAPNNDQELITKVIEMNRHPRMKEVFRHALTRWLELAGEYGTDSVGFYNQYSFCGNWGNYGCWGALESLYQDLDTAYKYQALLWPGRFIYPDLDGNGRPDWQEKFGKPQGEPRNRR